MAKIQPLDKRPSYMRPTSYPSEDTKRVLKLSREIDLIKKQTQYIKDNNLKAEDLRQLNQKKLDIF
ncbi:MAG: hypothetical protein VXV96_14730 [Bdellovibrionota bacterium]|nr:hypothetical protein [Bdellovibrionota bacterium]